jgi:hypothetical protein
MSVQRTSFPTRNESPQNTSGRNLFASFTAHCLESGQGDSDEICH